MCATSIGGEPRTNEIRKVLRATRVSDGLKIDHADTDIAKQQIVESKVAVHHRSVRKFASKVPARIPHELLTDVSRRR